MITFRNATSEHIPLLRDMYIEDIEPHHERAAEFANQLVSNMKTILCFKGDAIQGTISWAIRGGMDDGVAEIVGLGVREPFKRQGVATSLVEEATKQIHDAFTSKQYRLRRVFLFMEHSNEVARKFYNHLGFTEVAEIPKFYPEDGASIFLREYE